MDAWKLNQIKIHRSIDGTNPLIAQLAGCSTNPVTAWVFLLARLADSGGFSRCSPDRVVTRRLPLRHPGKPLFATVTCIGGLRTHWWTGRWFCFIIFFVIPNPLVALVGSNPYTTSQFAMLNGEEVRLKSGRPSRMCNILMATIRIPPWGNHSETTGVVRPQLLDFT